MTRPTELNYVTTVFGKPGDWAAGYHTGIDYRAPTGTPVFATKGGKVIFSGWGGYGDAYGRHVILQVWHNGLPIRLLYAHLSKALVVPGQKVLAGQPVGLSGETGNTFGAHLHYEERKFPYGYYNHRRPLLPQWQPEDKTRLAKILERIKNA
jgi:murein DD-endopeptidase MepM/ murein hydrolase activator NlpD